MISRKFNHRFGKLLQIILPLFLGISILIWTYHGVDFSRVWSVLTQETNYWWMLLSLLFGILSHILRGLRWNLTLEPLGEYPKPTNSIYAVFVSYAANLVIPRIGEISRCGILAKYDGVSFSKAVGTVVTERIIDTLCISIIALITLLLQTNTFTSFFDKTGTTTAPFTNLFSSNNFYITLICLAGLTSLFLILFRKLAASSKIRQSLSNVVQGCLSLQKVKNLPLFLLYTIGIWVGYFLQFYIAFFCFEFSNELGVIAALVMFVAGSIAVIVPTPNGAGPWHFAIITMMMMYGVSKDNAGFFALLVHGVQTILLVLLGIYGLVALPLTNKKQTL